ncbi:hypothetical protein MKZ38_004205 [Zalerion maritima]|uniref:Uncharacterized protein n=1 Tax=Zalerion maritima TaxID=339359 RepID=A0AAD5RMP6_9PEZI|nr:hypothetical protein MKZ38_004205 [Zalerion maritima]
MTSIKLVEAGPPKPKTSRVDSDSQPAADESRRKRRRISGPDSGSLYGSMRKNAGTPLFVMPICWVDQHANLLNASWTELPPSTTPVPTPASKAQLKQPSVAASNLSRELTTLLSSDTLRPFAKLRAVKDIMNTLFPATMSRPRSAAELDIHVGSRTVKKAVRLQVAWKSPETPISLTSFDSAATLSADAFGSQRPSQYTTSQSQLSRNQADTVLAYMNRAHLATVRQHLFRIVPHPSQTVNVPVSRLQQLRSKMLVPANPDHDAHFVAIFVAMAQRQLYGEPGSASSSQSSQGSTRSTKRTKGSPAFRDIKVQFMTTDDEAADFICYTAVVSEGLLRKFHSPYRVPRGATVSDGIDITYTRVPIWPVLGLKERLGKALGCGIAGDIGEDDFETWGMQATRKVDVSTSTTQPGSSDTAATNATTPQSYHASQSSVSCTTSPRQGIKRPLEREALGEIMNRSFEEKDEHMPAPTIAAAVLTAALKSPRRGSPRESPRKTNISMSLGLPSSTAMGSPTKRRRISGPRRRSTSEVDVSV